MSPIPSTEPADTVDALVDQLVPETRYLAWSNDKGGFHNARQHGYTHHVTDARRFTADQAAALMRQNALDRAPEAPNLVLVPAPEGNRYQSSDTTHVMVEGAKGLAVCLLISAAGAVALENAAAAATRVTSNAERVQVLRRMAAILSREASRLDLLGDADMVPHPDAPEPDETEEAAR